MRCYYALNSKGLPALSGPGVAFLVPCLSIIKMASAAGAGCQDCFPTGEM